MTRRAWIALLAGAGAVQPAFAQQPIAFTHVSVIDGRDSLPRTDQTVIVSGDRIAAVGPAAGVPVPPGARLIDGRGRYLVPGFWDMHVHTDVPAGRTLLPLFVANGVTGVRDMGGTWRTLRAWRDSIARGELVGPRMVLSGPYIEGGDSPIPHLAARTPAEGVAAVDSLASLGVDVIKVHTQLTPATYFAVARRARERGIPFAGHVSRAVGSAAASDSGQRSIEHMLAIPAPCTPAESIALQPRYPVQGSLGRCSSADLTGLYARLVRNGTWVTPTFTAAVEIAAWPARDVPGDSLAHYFPDTLRAFVAQIFPMVDSIPPGADSVGRQMLARRMAQAAAMQRAGVRILTGTDVPLRNSPAGFGLHEEMALLVRGGMRPWDALRAATWEPAAYLGRQDSMGAVAAGMRADLVLLAANPLADIGNTRRIAAVVAAGRLFERGDLDRLLRAGR